MLHVKGSIILKAMVLITEQKWPHCWKLPWKLISLQVPVWLYADLGWVSLTIYTHNSEYVSVNLIKTEFCKCTKDTAIVAKYKCGLQFNP